MRVQLLPNRVDSFDAAFDVDDWHLGVAHLPLDVRGNLVEKCLVRCAAFFKLRRDLSIVFGVKILERQIFQLAAQFSHSEPVGNRRVNVHRFLRDASPLVRTQEFKRAHVMQAIGELDKDDAHVVNHRQQHLANIFRLLFFT